MSDLFIDNALGVANSLLAVIAIRARQKLFIELVRSDTADFDDRISVHTTITINGMNTKKFSDRDTRSSCHLPLCSVQ